MGLNNFTSNPTDDDMNGIPFSSQCNPISTGGIPIEISDCLINYNEKYKNGGNALFRDSAIQQTLSVLISKNKPNPLLIGLAGVGKTKIVEDIAYRIVTKDALIPKSLQNATIYEVPLSSIVAGCSIVGALEEKMKMIIEFAEDENNDAILFIDEIHQIMENNTSYDKIGQILKPALARGSIRVIGATTLQEVQSFMKDPALNRRFSKVIVDELSRDETIEILEKSKAGFYAHYNNMVTISDEVIEDCAIIADEYRPAGVHRPDNAITLLDRTIGDAIIARHVLEQSAINDPALYQAIKATPTISITKKQLKQTALKLVTGTNKKADLDIDKLRNKMTVIKGQDEIVDKLIELMRKNDLNIYPKTQPLTLLFAGTSGVGKTQVTKILAEELTGVKPIILNMTEYHSPASINRIIGSPAGYVGSDSNAELPFDSLESNPYQVILLDEFEKSDKAVQRLFMSAFEEGTITTARGKKIDFSKSIIIATTNAAHSTPKSSMGFTESNNKKTKKSVVKELSQWFDVELLNRFKEIYEFNELNKEDYKTILIDIYERDSKRICAEHRKIKLPESIPENELEEIIERTYVPEFGARPAKNAIKEYIENQI